MRIGIDLGGTKIEGIALAGSRELARVRIPTPRDDYAATIDAIASVVADLEARAGTRGTVGIGIPGTLSPATGLVKNANSVWLIGTSLRDDIQQRLGREVRMANDANCFAVSEAADGAAAGAEVVFGVIVGTGTGAGVVVHGRPLTGPNAIAGEWGHNPLPWPEDDERPGPVCYCGRHGCIETFLSGPGLARDFEQRSGLRLTARQIVAAASGGAGKLDLDEQQTREGQAEASPYDCDAEAALARYEHRMARALASVINILDPDVIVLGGGLSNIERLYENVPKLWGDFVFGADGSASAFAEVGSRRDPTRQCWLVGPPGRTDPADKSRNPACESRVPNPESRIPSLKPRVPNPEPRAPSVERVRTRLARATHGDASGVRGAAWLWPLDGAQHVVG